MKRESSAFAETAYVSMFRAFELDFCARAEPGGRIRVNRIEQGEIRFLDHTVLAFSLVSPLSHASRTLACFMPSGTMHSGK